MNTVAKTVGAFVLLVLAAPCAIGNTAVTVLTVDGQAHRVTGVAKARLMRSGTSESGHSVLMDEYAVVSIEHDGLRYAATSPGYGGSDSELKRVARFVQPVSADISRDSQSASARLLAPRALLIQHDLAHPNNARFAPMPTVSFERQRIEAGNLNGEQGFAIVSMGESGTVLRVELLSRANGSEAQLRQAISRGMRTAFQDERRHDHTVYMAYEVQNDTLVQLGQPFVVVPQCCGPEPPCNPVCP